MRRATLEEMGCLEALRRIRADERTKHLPVVMFSSTGFPDDLREAYDSGANSFIDKASEGLSYPELVPLMVRYWLFVNKVPNGGS